MSIPEETRPLAAGVAVLARSYPKGHHIPPHRHDWHQLVYASAGVMTVTTAAGAWVVPPQRAVWMPAGTEHEIDCASAIAMRTLYFETGGRDPLPASCAVVQVAPLLRELIVSAVEAAGPTARREHLAALISTEIETAAVAPLHLPEPRDRRLLRITETLRTNPGDTRTLAVWSREVGASRRTLSRLFLAETGMTFRAWQRQRRLLSALVGLAEGQPVTTVALDLGYDSPSAFINAFHRALGTTPGRYFGAPSPGPRG